MSDQTATLTELTRYTVEVWFDLKVGQPLKFQSRANFTHTVSSLSPTSSVYFYYVRTFTAPNKASEACNGFRLVIALRLNGFASRKQ